MVASTSRSYVFVGDESEEFGTEKWIIVFTVDEAGRGGSWGGRERERSFKEILQDRL